MPIVVKCQSLFLEIVDGNLKMTLGMIWTIILRFAIQDISVEGEKHFLNSFYQVNSRFANDVAKKFQISLYFEPEHEVVI